MATLEITNKTLNVIGAPKKDNDPLWLRFMKLLFSKKKEHQDEDTYMLSAYKSVGLRHDMTPLSPEWLMTQGLRPRDYWVLSLCELHQNATQVIASRDEVVMRDAHSKIKAAMNADKPFQTSVNIENSTVVVDSYVGRDAKTNVTTSDPPHQQQKS